MVRILFVYFLVKGLSRQSSIEQKSKEYNARKPDTHNTIKTKKHTIGSMYQVHRYGMRSLYFQKLPKRLTWNGKSGVDGTGKENYDIWTNRFCMVQMYTPKRSTFSWWRLQSWSNITLSQNYFFVKSFHTQDAEVMNPQMQKESLRYELKTHRDCWFCFVNSFSLPSFSKWRLEYVAEFLVSVVYLVSSTWG